MKMGNDDEKASPPMFPRLHVNDTEKGGPKAPPRNKMALYEQLSIPSQRFNPGVFPLRPNNSSKVVPIPSSSQPSIPIHQAERYDTRRNNEANLNSALAQLEHSKEVGDDDDLRVPVFDQSRMDPRNTQNGISRENVASSGLMYSGSSKIVRSYGLNKSRASISSSRISLVQEVTGRSQDGLVSDAQSAKSATNFSRGYMIDGFVTEANASLNQDFQDSKACDIDDCVGQESRAIELPDDSENEVGFQPGSDYYSGEKHSNLNDIDNDSGHSVNGIYSPSQEGNQERSDAVSETSMLDSISCFDISPDDVVEMIGLEHFWKARRAIIKLTHLNNTFSLH